MKKIGHTIRFNLMILIVIMSTRSLYAQDLHFSQFFNSPLSSNPANTGFIPASDYRIGMNYRDQWAMLPTPYKTNSLWGDAQVLRDKIPGGWIGLGGMILQDVAGSGNLKSTKIYSSVAYHQMLGNTGLLSAGFNLGYAGKQLNMMKFTFDNQWNGKFFDTSIPSGEIFQNTSIGYFDMQAGLNYAWFPTDDIYVHGGFSVHHLNRPVETFFAPSTDYDNRISSRSIFFIDGMMKVNPSIILTPSFYYTKQANTQEMIAGIHLNYNVKGSGENQLILGAYVRPNDAIIPMVGYQFGNFKFMFSYDATSSPIKYFNTSKGATELFMQYDGYYEVLYGNRKQSFCPHFD